MASRLLAIWQSIRRIQLGVSVNDILQMMQQQGNPPAPQPDDPTLRSQRMLSMLGVLSGDPALSNFGRTSLSEMDKQAEMKQRLDQESYQRQQNSTQNNIGLARLTQGDSEQQQNRQLRRDALAQSLREFNERQQAAKDQENAALLDPQSLEVASHDTLVDPTHIRTYAAGNSKAAQAVRKQIIDRQAQIMQDAGLTGADLPSLRANAKAQAGSTQELVKQQNAIAAYADPEVQNFQRLNELSKKVDTTGIPFLEQFIRQGKVMSGDPDAAEFNSLITSTRTGAARLLNNPALNGVLSDSARD
jgi:hypothetical protein